MDKNQTLGFFLIGIVFVGYMLYNKPTEEQIKQDQAQKDSLKIAESTLGTATAPIVQDSVVFSADTSLQTEASDSLAMAKEQEMYGIFSSALNKEYFNSENVNYAIKTTYLKNLIDVMPESITLPNSIEIYNKPLTEKIKLLSDFIPIIRVK